MSRSPPSMSRRAPSVGSSSSEAEGSSRVKSPPLCRQRRSTQLLRGLCSWPANRGSTCSRMAIPSEFRSTGKVPTTSSTCPQRLRNLFRQGLRRASVSGDSIEEVDLEVPLNNAFKQHQVTHEVSSLREQLKTQPKYNVLFADSERMAEVRDLSSLARGLLRRCRALQRLHERGGCSGNHDLAVENIAGGDVTSVEILVVVAVGLQNAAGQIDPRKQALRARIGKDFSLQLRIGHGASIAADRTGRNRGLAAQGDLVLEQVIDPTRVHDQQHEIHHF